MPGKQGGTEQAAATQDSLEAIPRMAAEADDADVIIQTDLKLKRYFELHMRMSDGIS